jgi:hypothetical protein
MVGTNLEQKNTTMTMSPAPASRSVDRQNSTEITNVYNLRKARCGKVLRKTTAAWSGCSASVEMNWCIAPLLKGNVQRAQRRLLHHPAQQNFSIGRDGRFNSD